MDNNTPYPRRVPALWALQGDQQIVSADTSIFREGSAWQAQPGSSLYALCGNQYVMKYWTHNLQMDADCSFVARDDAGACIIWAYCEDETERWFAAPLAPRGTLPAFTQTAQYNHLTGLWTLGQIAGIANAFSAELVLTSGSAYTITTAQLGAGQSVLLILNSNSGAAKVVTLPASTGSLKRLLVLDGFGDAATNNITFTGATVVGANLIYTNKGQLWLTDTLSLGWVAGI